MKITDPQVIQQGEKDLIASVQEDLDLDAVRKILKERMSVAALSSRGGQIVVHDNQIAFRLDFEINLSGSLLFDRDGNLIEEAPALESDQENLPQEVAPPVQEREPDDGMLLDNDLDDDLDDNLDDDALMDDELSEDSMDLGDGLDDEADDFSVDLPDYGIGVDPAQAPDIENPDTGIEDIDQELELAAEELALEDLGDEEDDFLDDEDSDDPDFQGIMDGDEDDNPFGDDDMESQDLDDDINDILKESREFWEQKKES